MFLIWFKYLEIENEYLPMFLSEKVALQEHPLG